MLHDTQEGNGPAVSDDFWQYSSSASCIHTPSGLNLTLAYAKKDNKDLPLSLNKAGDPVVIDPDFWYIQGGLSRRWNSHGKTNISIAYGKNTDIKSAGDDINIWGVAVVQKIDSAALELYAAYHRAEYDDDVTDIVYQDINWVLLGARMKF